MRALGIPSRNPTYDSAAGEGWLLSLPELNEWRGPGRTCVSALRGERMGQIEHPLNHSKGCGGVMRVAPVGLALALDDPFRLAVAIAAVTHGHPSGYLAAGCQALVVRELLLGSSLADAIEVALAELRRHPNHGELLAAAERAVGLAARGAPTPEAVESLGAGWVAEEALAIALYCAWVAPNLASGLRLAVNHGGDSDSTGAIAGNLLGAIYGEGAIPLSWLGVLELRTEIERIADEICDALAATALSPVRSGRSRAAARDRTSG